MPNDLKHLDALENAEQLRPWLQRALQGHEPLALLTPDEPPYFALLRGRGQLKKATREDLDTACGQLVDSFVQTGHGEPEYVDSLLHLASGLKLDSVVIPLQRFARRFADFPQLPTESKRAVLSTLIKLHARLDVQFWKDLYHRHGDELAGSVYSGLFACEPNEALLFLPKIPDVQAMADALSLQLQRYTERLPPEERGAVVRKVQAALPKCSAALKLAIGEWFEEVGIETAPAQAVTVPVEKSHREPSFRNYPALDSLIAKYPAAFPLARQNRVAKLNCPQAQIQKAA
jgi:hypothetical protein